MPDEHPVVDILLKLLRRVMYDNKFDEEMVATGYLIGIYDIWIRDYGRIKDE
jgi:hypothetical protein